MKNLLGKVIDLWQHLPRVVQYGLASAALATVDHNFPGHLPPGITPEIILGGGLAGAAMHHLEDRHNGAKK